MGGSNPRGRANARQGHRSKRPGSYYSRLFAPDPSGIQIPHQSKRGTFRRSPTFKFERFGRLWKRSRYFTPDRYPFPGIIRSHRKMRKSSFRRRYVNFKSHVAIGFIMYGKRLEHYSKHPAAASDHFRLNDYRSYFQI